MKKQQPEQRISALYARLSRDDEKEGISGSIQNQRAILEKFAQDNHLPNPKFFFDDGYSGVTFTRPAFMEIMELAEQGLVANLVVKDHSRLGRNRLVVGQLLEEDFVRLNVRYIAIMDNIDTARGVSDIVPMQDLFNEWHAKNTSDKVRRVMQSRGSAGIPLTTNPPFGYRKAPEDRNRWLVDEPAAEVVRRIFRMSVSGLGPTQIAKRLKAECVMTPSEYLHSTGVKCPAKSPAFPHNWCSATVADILDRQEYTGDTVNFRSFTAEPAPGGVEGLSRHPPRHHRPGGLRLGPRPSPTPPPAYEKRHCQYVLRAALLRRLRQQAGVQRHQQLQAGAGIFLLFRLPQQYPCLFRPFHPGECSRGTGAGGPAAAAVVHPGL